MGVYSAYEIVFYRYFIAAIFFMVIIYIKKERLVPYKKDIPKFLVGSLFGITLFSMLAIFAMNWISTSIVGMLNGTVPVITLLIERFWFKKKLSKNMILSLVIALLGIIMMSMPIGFGDIIGYILVLTALFLWVIYSFIINDLSKSYSDMQIMGFQNLYGSVVLMPFIFLKYGKESVMKLLDIEVLSVVLFLSLGITAVGYLFYLKGSKLIGLAKMSLIINLVPVVSLIAGYIMYQEPISTQKIIGLVLVLLSIFLLSPKFTSTKLKKAA